MRNTYIYIYMCTICTAYNMYVYIYTIIYIHSINDLLDKGTGGHSREHQVQDVARACTVHALPSAGLSHGDSLGIASCIGLQRISFQTLFILIPSFFHLVSFQPR